METVFFISRRDELLRCALCGSARACDSRRGRWVYAFLIEFLLLFLFIPLFLQLFMFMFLVHCYIHSLFPTTLIPTCISHTTQPQSAKPARFPFSISNSCDQSHIWQTPSTVFTGRAPLPEGCQSTCLTARCWDGRHPV